MDERDRIVVAGSTCDRVDNDAVGCELVVARFLPNGELDRSFGSGCRTTTAFPGEANGRAVALTSHGIVAAGVADGEIALARYKRDGRLDESFGSGGTVTTDIRAGDESGNSVAIASHGRIVVASGGGALAVTEYSRDGHLRQAFGVRGTATALFHGYNAANSLAVDSRGRIVAAGYTQFEERGGADRAAFAVARFRPSGKLDDSFSHDGKVKTRFTTFVDYANAVAIDSRGRIVAAGLQSGLQNPAVARYRRDGRLDDPFSGDGKAWAKLGMGAEAVAIDSRDRIVTGGDSDKEFGLARFIGYRRG
jgi:uncharacterized delta-60 repeat protein